MDLDQTAAMFGLLCGDVAIDLGSGGGRRSFLVGTGAYVDPYRVAHGNDADALMEEARAKDCHRDALDAMGLLARSLHRVNEPG